jgi:hypothetical protein
MHVVQQDRAGVYVHMCVCTFYCTLRFTIQGMPKRKTSKQAPAKQAAQAKKAKTAKQAKKAKSAKQAKTATPAAQAKPAKQATPVAQAKPATPVKLELHTSYSCFEVWFVGWKTAVFSKIRLLGARPLKKSYIFIKWEMRFLPNGKCSRNSALKRCIACLMRTGRRNPRGSVSRKWKSSCSTTK